MHSAHMRGVSGPDYRYSQYDARKHHDISSSQEEQYSSPDGYFDSDQDDTDDEDLSPLKYAQRHGLIAIHSKPSAFQGVVALPSDKEVLADLDGPYWHSAQVQDEKWNVDRATSRFLASVLDLGKDRGCEDVQDARPRFEHLKMEKAILFSDPQLEDLQLASRNRAVITTAGMKPFKTNDERGEGLAWSAEILSSPVAANETVSKERLDVNAEAILCIREAMEVIALDWTAMTDLALSQETVRTNLLSLFDSNLR